MEALFTGLVFVTFVRPYVTAGVGPVKYRFKMVGVMFFGGADVAFADEFIFPVSADTEFVAMVAFTVFLRPAGFRILLATLGRCPGRRVLPLVPTALFLPCGNVVWALPPAWHRRFDHHGP